MAENQPEQKPAPAPAPAPYQKQKQKEKESAIKMEGVVVEALKGSFKVKIPAPKPGGQDMYVLAHLAGKLRKNSIKIVPGDRVEVEISPYDISKARIVFRLK